MIQSTACIGLNVKGSRLEFEDRPTLRRFHALVLCGKQMLS